jgi:hypothetical protein
MIEDFTIYLLWSLSRDIPSPHLKFRVLGEGRCEPWLKEEAANSSRNVLMKNIKCIHTKS